MLLDNKDGQIPVKSEEVAVKKSLNTASGNETYHINGKPIDKSDLFSLFESGGFSLQ